MQHTPTRFLSVVFLLAGLSAAPLIAQQPIPDSSAYTAVIQTNDGNTFIGEVVSEDSVNLVVRTQNFGQITIRREFIQSIRPVGAERIKHGKHWFETPHTGRYFASSSAYGLRKGQGYYENGWIFLNQVSYGFSDRFSLGVGLAPVFIFDDGIFPVWLTPKITIPLKTDRINFAVGGLLGRSFSSYAPDRRYFGATYGQFTFGPPDAHLSAGAGVSFSENNWSTHPIFSLSGFARVAPRFALVMENYQFNSDGERYTLLSLGGRFISRPVSIDAAMVASFSQYGAFDLLPWVGLHVPFGRTR